MKITRFLSAILFLLILSATLTGCLATYAESSPEAKAESGVSSNEDINIVNEDLSIISEGIDALKLAGMTTNSKGNWGAHQTRYVSTSHGKYLGVYLDIPFDYNVGSEWSMVTLIRVNDDGSCEKVYTDYWVGGESSVSVMVDKEEDIWMYAGYADGDFLDAAVWHYDVSEGSITTYRTQQRVGKFGDASAAYKKSTSVIDPENGKIYGILTYGNVPAWFGWVEFDIETKEWQPYLVSEIEANVHYNYSYADGNGGFFTVAERCTQVLAAKSDIEGMYVSEAIRTFRSRSFDAGDVWDELYLIHVPDPAVNDFELIVVDKADYDVKNGIYPGQNNMFNDVLIDSRGNVHVLYTTTDDGTPGIRKNHKIYDLSDNFKLLYEGEVSFLYGANMEYGNRLYEDLAGNVYIIAASCAAKSQIEIWKATDDLKSQFVLVHNEYLRGMGNTIGTGAFILAHSRGNSKPSNIAHIAVPMNDSWYTFEIDLTAFAD